MFFTLGSLFWCESCPMALGAVFAAVALQASTEDALVPVRYTAGSVPEPRRRDQDRHLQRRLQLAEDRVPQRVRLLTNDAPTNHEPVTGHAIRRVCEVG